MGTMGKPQGYGVGDRSVAERLLIPDYTQAPTQVSLSGVTARSTQLTPGWYILSCTEAGFVKAGGSGVNAATTDFPLQADIEYPLFVSGSSDDYVAGILASGTATLSIQPCI